MPIYRLKPTYNNEMYRALCQNDMPPTLYSLMQSKVNYGEEEQTKIEDLPASFRTYLFDFTYPLDNEFKSDFELNFLSHYMFRRINYDTYLAFKIHLKNKLNEIMPKYNLMFQGFSSLDFLGLKETTTRMMSDDRTGSESIMGTSSGTSSASSSASSLGTTDNRYSDTPQGQLASVQNGTYMSDYTYNQTSGSSSDTSSTTSSNTLSNNKLTSDNIDVSETKVVDKLDSIEEYKKYLEIANNIYSLIYKECDSLFYGLV